MDIVHALQSLRPGASWSILGEDYENLVWSNENDLPPPTKEEINQEIERLRVEYEYNQYQRNRKAEYPSIEDQLDTLYHQGYDGWREMITEVKTKYPKPGDG